MMRGVPAALVAAIAAARRGFSVLPTGALVLNRRGRSKPGRSHPRSALTFCRRLARWPMPTDDKQVARNKRSRERDAARGYVLAQDLRDSIAAAREAAMQ